MLRHGNKETPLPGDRRSRRCSLHDICTHAAVHTFQMQRRNSLYSHSARHRCPVQPHRANASANDSWNDSGCIKLRHRTQQRLRQRAPAHPPRILYLTKSASCMNSLRLLLGTLWSAGLEPVTGTLSARENVPFPTAKY